MVYLAWRMGIWRPEWLTGTLLWGIPAAFLVGFRALEAKKDWDFFRNRLRSVLSLAVLVEFLVQLEPFPLWWELIQVPLVTILVMLVTFVDTRDEFRAARWFFYVPLLALVGVKITVAVSRLFRQRSDHDWLQLGQRLALDLWLPLSLIPLVYAWCLFMLYQLLWRRLRWKGGGELPWGRLAGVVLAAGTRRRALMRVSPTDWFDLSRTTNLRDTWRTARRAMREEEGTGASL